MPAIGCLLVTPTGALTILCSRSSHGFGCGSAAARSRMSFGAEGSFNGGLPSVIAQCSIQLPPSSPTKVSGKL